MAKRTCKRPGCDKPHKAHGLCEKHYCILRTYGQVEGRPPDPDLPGERWLSIPGTEGQYEASNFARVRSFRVEGRPGYILTQSLGSNGYPRVSIILNGKRGPVPVHQLVAAAFHGDRPYNQETRHGDGDRTNALPSNLAYGTHTENMQDMIQHGTNYRANKTHCPAGHEYTPENTYINPTSGGRVCRECRHAPYELRGYGSHNRAKTHCPQGHEYTEQNTYIRPRGGRECRTCLREHQQRIRDARKLSKGIPADRIEAGCI